MFEILFGLLSLSCKFFILFLIFFLKKKRIWRMTSKYLLHVFLTYHTLIFNDRQRRVIMSKVVITIQYMQL